MSSSQVALTNTDGFWGPVTSTIDWCEPNYEVTHYIAEFWNTISNLTFIIFACFGIWISYHEGFELRYQAQYLGVLMIGIGSALFHGTLQYFEQQADETPMVWSILIWIYLIYEPDWHHHRAIRVLMPVILIAYGLIFALLHAIYRFTTGFQVHFAIIVIICLTRVYKHYQACEEDTGRRLARVYVYTLLVGFSLWLIDFHMCSTMRSLPFNPQGHAWWHVCMGINTYFGPAFAQYTRASQLGWRPVVRMRFGIPYVAATKIA